MSVVSLDGVRVVRTGGTILAIGSLAVESGEILVVLGPTGAGKSTLLRVLHLLEPPDAGTVRWHGEAVAWPPALALRRRATMAFQDPLLFHGTVAENVEFALRLRGLSHARRVDRVRTALAALGIAHLAQRPARTLSGGEAQRTALARALVIEPELLLLDEPLAALDAPIRESLRGELRALLKARGTTCVFVTHDQDEAWALADRVAVLDRGRIIQVGGRDDVFLRPATRFVAEFVRTGNVLAGRAVAPGEVAVGSLRLRWGGTNPANGDVLVCVRAERVGVMATPGEDENVLQARIVTVVDEGAMVRIDLDTGVPLTALITRGTADALAPSPGMRVFATMAAGGIHVIPAEETTEC